MHYRGVVDSSGVVARLETVVRVLVGVVLVVGLVGCQPEPAFVPTPTPSSSTPARVIGLPYGVLPEYPTDHDRYIVSSALVWRMFDLIATMERAGDYSAVPPELDEIMTPRYRELIQRNINAEAEMGLRFEGEFTSRNIATRQYEGGQAADVAYSLEACIDTSHLDFYDGSGTYLGRGGLRYALYRFIQESDRYFISDSYTEEVTSCPF